MHGQVPWTLLGWVGFEGIETRECSFVAFVLGLQLGLQLVPASVVQFVLA